MSLNYGLSNNDLLFARNKIDEQIKYLENNNITTNNGEIKTFRELSFGSNISSRYFSRILNKVDTFTSLALSKEHKGIFLTITLDGFFRDCMKGDYKRFKAVRDKYIKHIPNDSRNGFYLDAMDKGAVLTPKDLYKILVHQLHRFYRSGTLQKMRKNGFDYSSIRVTEPHKDGVPHIHIAFFCPREFFKDVYKEFVKFFPAPQNHKLLTMRQNKRLGQEISEGITETNGFQINIKNDASYILKYILKTFRNVEKEEKIGYMEAWYIKYRIPRIITTRTLMSQDICNKVYPVEKDWFYLTQAIKNLGYMDIDNINNKFTLVDGNNRKIYYNNGLLVLSYDNKVIKTIGKFKEHIPKLRLRALKFTTISTNFNILYRYTIYRTSLAYKYKMLFSFSDGTFFVLNKDGNHYFDFKSLDLDINIYKDTFYNKKINHFDIYLKSIKEDLKNIKDYTLFNKFNNFVFIDNVPDNSSYRYAEYHNELVERKIIFDEMWDLLTYQDIPI